MSSGQQGIEMCYLLSGQWCFELLLLNHGSGARGQITFSFLADSANYASWVIRSPSFNVVLEFFALSASL